MFGRAQCSSATLPALLAPLRDDLMRDAQLTPYLLRDHPTPEQVSRTHAAHFHRLRITSQPTATVRRVCPLRFTVNSWDHAPSVSHTPIAPVLPNRNVFYEVLLSAELVALVNDCDGRLIDARGTHITDEIEACTSRNRACLATTPGAGACALTSRQLRRGDAMAGRAPTDSTIRASPRPNLCDVRDDDTYDYSGPDFFARCGRSCLSWVFAFPS